MRFVTRVLFLFLARYRANGLVFISIHLFFRIVLIDTNFNWQFPIHSESLTQTQKLWTMCLLLVYKPYGNGHWPHTTKEAISHKYSIYGYFCDIQANIHSLTRSFTYLHPFAHSQNVYICKMYQHSWVCAFSVVSLFGQIFFFSQAHSPQWRDIANWIYMLTWWVCGARLCGGSASSLTLEHRIE